MLFRWGESEVVAGERPIKLMNPREIETGRGERIIIQDTQFDTVWGLYHGLVVEADTEQNLRAKINWLAYHGI